MRRFGEPISPDRAYRTRPGVYAVITRGRRVLITEQAEPEREFQLPGGGLDPGESPLAALHRECLEETGWAIRVERRLGAFQRYTYMPEYDLWARKVCTIYLARAGLRRGEPAEAGHSAHWLTPAEALGLLANEGDRRFLTVALA